MDHKVVFCFHTNEHEYNLGIGFLSAFLKQNEIAVDLVIYREIQGRQHDDVADIAARILAKNPTVVALSAMTLNWQQIRRLVQVLRPQFKGLIVAGGYHAVLSPAEVMAEPGIDAVCLGEGEHPLLELLRQYDRIDKRDFEPIHGIGFTSTNAPREGDAKGKGWMVDDLDRYPYIDFGIFDAEGANRLPQKHMGMLTHAGVFSLAVVTGRGCPYQCTYCSNSALIEHYGGLKGYLRKYSAERAVSHLKDVVDKHRPQFLEFLDETFSMSRKWVREFCDLYAREVGIPFSIMTRIDRLDDETIGIMADSGLKLAFIGVECGDEEYRIKYLKRRMSNDKIRKGAALLKMHGVSFFTFNIMGMPYETKETLAKTISLNEEIAPDAAAAFHFVPFPGTEMAKMAYAQHMVLPLSEMQWDFCHATIDRPDLPAAYVTEMVQRFRERFTNAQVVEAFYQKIRDAAAPRTAEVLDA